MKVLEDLVAPAVVSDLVSRLISFLTSQYVKKRTSQKGTARRLQLLTFKIHAVVDEAQQRDLASNRRLLLWVKKLIEGMYLAYYMLDISTHHVDDQGCALVTRSWSFGVNHPRKRPCLIGDDNCGIDQLSAVLRRLEVVAADMKEFIVLLACCPRISLPPPFSSSSSDDKVMFGRLVEREQIISFLLQPRSNLGVLPIVGDPEAGKGTIVKHVCSDERVRGHFAVIVYSYGSYLVQENCGQDMLRTLRIGGHVLHESSASGHERHLIVIKNTFEVVINLEVWTILCESLRLRAPGSKVIVISEKDNIADLGTAMAMRVNPLPWEEYWYFFMSLAFGGNNDQEEHSAELAVLGRQIAAVLHGSFFGAKVLGGILRMNLNKKFWEGVLDVVNNFNETMQGDGVDHFSKIRVANMVLKTLPLPLKLKSALQQTRSDDLELTGMTVQELLHSAPVPHRKEMRIILWESACPPNYRYIVVCEKVKAEHACVETERKRRRNQQ